MIDKDIVNIIDEIRNESELKPENEKQLYHKNCGETVMEALKIKYELNIVDNAIKMLAPYGFGLQRGCLLYTSHEQVYPKSYFLPLFFSVRLYLSHLNPLLFRLLDYV